MATFSEIVKRLYLPCNDGKNAQDFLCALFSGIAGEDSDHPIFDIKPGYLRRFYNGERNLSADNAKFLLHYLNTEKHLFIAYIENFGDDILDILCTKFADIAGVCNSNDIADKIADLLTAALEKLVAKTKSKKAIDSTANMNVSEEVAPFVPVSLKPTINPRDFEKIFTPVICELSKVSLFHLSNIRNNAFQFDDLRQFLRRNIGRYVLSRAVMDKMIDNGDIEIIGAKAIELLKAAGGFDYSKLSDELGDIILYVFLEQVLEAPKIYSKIQLTENGTKAVNRGGVHLLRLDSPCDSYQLVIGKSNIVGDLQTAIDNAFTSIIEAKNSESQELQLLDSTILTSQSFTTQTDIDYLKSVIFPTKEKTPTSTINNAFGVFLGYSLDVDKAGNTDAQFRSAIVEKMQADILAQSVYIAEKIKANDMGAYDFYFYLLPFNNAGNDKLSIIKALLGGDSV